MRGDLDLGLVGPFLDRLAGDGLDVIARLVRHRAFLGEPVHDAARASVIGRSRKTDIAELLEQFAQEACGRRDRLNRIERIMQFEHDGGATPRAPAWLTTRCLNLLSCQISRAKKAGGSPVSSAARASASQTSSTGMSGGEVSSVGSVEMNSGSGRLRRTMVACWMPSRMRRRSASRASSIAGSAIANRSAFSARAGDNAYCQEKSKISRNVVPDECTMVGSVDAAISSEPIKSRMRKISPRAQARSCAARALTPVIAVEDVPSTSGRMCWRFANRMRQRGGNLMMEELRRNEGILNVLAVVFPQ
jgi:hypothetical protein